MEVDVARKGRAPSQVDEVEPDGFDCDGQFHNPTYKFNYDMSRDEVIFCIDKFFEDWVDQLLSENQAMELWVPSRSTLTDSKGSIDSHSRRVCFTQVSSAAAYSRMICVLSIIREKLENGQHMTQREIFYRLIEIPQFRSIEQATVNNCIRDICSMLQIPRICLGILAAHRGQICGLIRMKDGSSWIDCSDLTVTGRQINPDIKALLQMDIEIFNCRYVIVVEKDAIFQQLLELRIFEKLPSVIITGMGYPDLATRVLLGRLAKDFPFLLILGLFDWDPHGLQIFSTYKYGSGEGLEAAFHTVDIKLLGLKSEDVPDHGRLPLNDRELRTMDRLRERLQRLDSTQSYLTELEQMKSTGTKAELESIRDLESFVCNGVLSQNYS